MSMTAFATFIDQTAKKFIVDGEIQLAGNYVAQGDTLDLSDLGIPASKFPLRVEAWSEVDQGAASVADSYIYVPGNGLTDGKLQVLAAGVEVAAAAYAGQAPSNAAGYKLKFRAEFEKFL
jgi:hypothetical protein